jgi:hypothetical protein
MSENKYNVFSELDHQNSDIIAHYIDEKNELSGDPVVLINKLPIEIFVTQDLINFNKTLFVGKIAAHGTLKLPYNSVTDGDTFRFEYCGSFYNNIELPKRCFVCPSHSVTKRHGSIIIGTVSSYAATFRRDIMASNDIASINMHNMLPWPVMITIDEKPIIYLQGNIDLENKYYHGDLTTSPSVYYDNFNMGIKLDTIFKAKVNIKNKNPKESKDSWLDLYSFCIGDKDLSEIFIGMTSTLIDKKLLTSTTPGKYPQNTTGTSIYRLGMVELDKTGSRGKTLSLIPKNFPPEDKNRTNFIYPSQRSTVPYARYKQLSNGNIICL